MAGEFKVGVPDLSALRAGNTGVEGVWQFEGAAPGRHVMISALIHGNELCGAWALKGLLESGLRPAYGKLTLMFCNLAAFDTFDAGNHDASRFVDEDLNRQWTAGRMQAGGSRERLRARELSAFVDDADWLLDLHSMHEHAAPLCLPGLLPDNTALALQMKSSATIVVDGGHDDGVRMRDYGHFGTAAGAAEGARSLLVECGFHGDPSSVAVAKDQCVRFLELAGIVDRFTENLVSWKLPDSQDQRVLTVTGKAVAASASASFVQPFQGLEVIEKAGTVIGNDGKNPIVTPHDGCVLVMPSLRQAREGVTVVRFARYSPPG